MHKMCLTQLSFDQNSEDTIEEKAKKKEKNPELENGR